MAKKKTILSEDQQRLLDEISHQKIITDRFYLGGGTALAEYYLQHRLSEDLDFFSEEEFDPFAISTFLKSVQKKLGINTIDYQQSFNRNLFFVTIGKEIIKMEFTYYPFHQLEHAKKINHLKIDSLLDIAVNKVFTLYQKPRSRDFIDLYLIMKKKKWSLASLLKKARLKFDYHIDLLQFGSQLIKVTELKDYPHMITPLSHKIWQDFFLKEAQKMNRQIFE